MSPVSLSGFLPGEDAEGLSALSDQLIGSWEQAVRRGRDAGEATEVVVIGVLRGASLKTYRDPSVRPPSLELRFAAVEPVILTGQRDQILALLRHLADERAEVQPIPGIDHPAELPDPNNVAEPDRPKRPRRGGKDGPGLHSVDDDGASE